MLSANLVLDLVRSNWGGLHASQIVVALVALHRLVGSHDVAVVPRMAVVADAAEVVHVSCRDDVDLLICEDRGLHRAVLLLVEGGCVSFVARFVGGSLRLFWLR